MDIVSYMEVDIVGFAIAFLIYWNLHEDTNHSLDYVMFRATVVVGLFMLIVDAATWAFNGATFPGSREANIISECLYYAGTGLSSFLWFRYCVFRGEMLSDNKSGKHYLSLIPLVVNAIIAVMSIWTGWYFVIDDAAVYHRGVLFPLYAVIGAGYLLAASIVALRTARQATIKDERTDALYLALFSVPPILAAVAQTVFYGVSLVWVCTALSLLLVYMRLQNTRVSTDPLTELNNRRSLDRYLVRRLGSLNEGETMQALVIDYDDFKSINDTFGHSVGDQALIDASGVLKSACACSDDFLARFGGDEFAIVGVRPQGKNMDEIVLRIKQGVAQFNSVAPANSYNISLSVGWGATDSEERDINAMFNRADKDMYGRKLKKKAAR